MVLKVNRVIQIQCKAIEFFRLARIFFSLTFRVKIFFSNLLWARIFFSSHSGPEYFFVYNTNLEANFIVTNRLQNYCIEVVCLSVCLCVCVCPQWIYSGMPISNTLQYNLIWGYIPPELSCIEIWHSQHSRTLGIPHNCQWLGKHPNCICVNTFCILKFFEVQYLHK